MSLSLDTAKEVHRNATMEAISVLRLLSDRENRMQNAWENSREVLQVIVAGQFPRSQPNAQLRPCKKYSTIFAHL